MRIRNKFHRREKKVSAVTASQDVSYRDRHPLTVSHNGFITVLIDGKIVCTLDIPAIKLGDILMKVPNPHSKRFEVHNHHLSTTDAYTYLPEQKVWKYTTLEGLV